MPVIHSDFVEHERHNYIVDMHARSQCLLIAAVAATGSEDAVVASTPTPASTVPGSCSSTVEDSSEARTGEEAAVPPISNSGSGSATAGASTVATVILLLHSTSALITCLL